MWLDVVGLQWLLKQRKFKDLACFELWKVDDLRRKYKIQISIDAIVIIEFIGGENTKYDKLHFVCAVHYHAPCNFPY